ncbi:HAD-IA family hydrolase [Arboricoccus pini]|nr:HAD-IA family hydrolase [Arboricoccus pini]
MRLIIFDLDGTLVDSQATIVACTRSGFAAEGLEPPPAQAIRRIIGLSLVKAMEVLLGRSDPVLAARIAEGYRAAFQIRRNDPTLQEPLFPGSRAMLEDLSRRGLIMGVATGKSMRGVHSMLTTHDLGGFFTTLQAADGHPSKPHPSMLIEAMAETGVAPEQTAMIGDTSYDMEMAKAAGVRPIGVDWGNHDRSDLLQAGAVSILSNWQELTPALGLHMAAT